MYNVILNSLAYLINLHYDSCVYYEVKMLERKEKADCLTGNTTQRTQSSEVWVYSALFPTID